MSAILNDNQTQSDRTTTAAPRKQGIRIYPVAFRPCRPRTAEELETASHLALKSRLGEDVRHDLVQRVREEILRGDYDRPEVWDAVAEGILGDLEGRI